MNWNETKETAFAGLQGATAFVVANKETAKDFAKITNSQWNAGSGQEVGYDICYGGLNRHFPNGLSFMAEEDFLSHLSNDEIKRYKTIIIEVTGISSVAQTLEAALKYLQKRQQNLKLILLCSGIPDEGITEAIASNYSLKTRYLAISDN